MNSFGQDNDDAVFDRLVDGELSPDDRRRLVASLDDRTDGWRRCALAFLEAQTWRGQMRALVESRPEQAAAPPATLRVAKPDRASRWSRITGSVFTTAAGLMIAFTLGWRMNSAGDLSSQRPADMIANSPAEDVAPPAADGDAITLVVHDRQGVPRRLQVPLVEGSRLGEQFAVAPQWAGPEMRERLAEQGFDLQARRRYAPLFFEQQDRIVPMVVPVDDAVVMPVSRTIY